MARFSRWSGVIAFLLCSALAYGQHQSAQPDCPIVKVGIKNLQFVPNNITVAPGTTIRWTNLDAVDHDVTSGTSITGRKARGLAKTRFPDNKFSSGLFGKDKSFSVTLDRPGEYTYYCSVHPFMTGKITVK